MSTDDSIKGRGIPREIWPVREMPMRRPIPDSGELQESILAATRGMPQFTKNMTGSSEHKRRTPRRLAPWVSSNALAAAACLIVVIGMGIVEPTLIKDMVTGTDKDNVPGSDELTANELDFQELMLIDDELLFAQL